MITKIKKYIFKNIIEKRLYKLSEKFLSKLYDIYDYACLDDELRLISKELRVRFVKKMSIDDFIKYFGDFKTADMWINEAWPLQ